MKRTCIYLTALLLLAACRTEEPVIPSTSTGVTHPDPDAGEVKGFFLLNEGNMGSNKATLDYYDYTTGVYTRNLYAERNPGVVKELGDVGNDLQIYGDKLYAVINCSHLVEVMDVNTAKHIATVSVPNCRYIVFKDRFAYVSSYAGPVQLDPNARLGYVAKVDTASLQVVAECVVGYQPEQMAVVGDKLYVANSGGYRAPDYETRVSVIDLETFTETKKIETGLINLHRLALDRYGNLWVSSRGDQEGVPSRTFVIDTRTDEVTDVFELPNAYMARFGDVLYVSDEIGFATIDTRTREIVSRNFITDGTEAAIVKPYGLAVNPATGELFVTDATNYVTPGKLHCYTPGGQLKWSVTTGDIPAHIAFVHKKLQPVDPPSVEKPEPGTEVEPKPGTEPEPGTEPDGAFYRPATGSSSPHSSVVFEFLPAPGQFVNEGYTATTMAEACTYAAECLASGSVLSLGGFGGYIVVGFDHSILADGGYDLQIRGNAFADSSEPGIVWVMRDENGDGQPNDTWYELKGSDYATTTHNYAVTYYKPTESGQPVAWTDNRGGSGQIDYLVVSHRQPSYYPAWVTAASYTLTGSRLPARTTQAGYTWKNGDFAWGYADNFGADAATRNLFRISDAVCADGTPAELPFVDFVKVQTAINAKAGRIGELSTEVLGVGDYNLMK